jgi:trehalose 6-phosphate synthase
VVASNRGPLSFSYDAAGELGVRRGAGGLVVTLGPGVMAAGALWLGAALSDADRQAAAGGDVESSGFRVRSLVIDADDYRAYYDVVANGTLWYALHGLWDLPRRPRFDRHWHQAWDRYQAVNTQFAIELAETAAPGATVLVQDYHLALVPAALAALRSDLHISTFLHTPWCAPSELAVLPDKAWRAILQGLNGDGLAVGFHSSRWSGAFEACSAELVGIRARTFVAPAAPDPEDTSRVATSPACTAALQDLERQVADRFFVVRVDRIELSKNVLRGFHAFDELLYNRPDLRGRVTFGAFVYPSRTGLTDYLAYGQEVNALARVVNDKWGDGQWTPILLDTDDDYPRSVAALRRADALLVNPVRDGLNLVAKELSLVNERDALLVLSDRAGCADELADYAQMINPFDVTATAAALGAAYDMARAERAGRAAGMRKVVRARTPADWFADLVAAAG